MSIENPNVVYSILLNRFDRSMSLPLNSPNNCGADTTVDGDHDPIPGRRMDIALCKYRALFNFSQMIHIHNFEL